MDENGKNRGIDAPAERAKNPAIAYLRANLFYGGLDKRFGCPVRCGLADPVDEVSEEELVNGITAGCTKVLVTCTFWNPTSVKVLVCCN